MANDWTGNSNSIYKTLGASNHTDKEREENDFYATQPIAIDKLYATGELTCKDIWECACGQGDLSKRLEDFGYNVTSTDLIDRGYGKGGVDFFECNKVFNGDILTNPPYKYAKEFALKGLELVPEGIRYSCSSNLHSLKVKLVTTNSFLNIRRKRFMSFLNAFYAQRMASSKE